MVTVSKEVRLALMSKFRSLMTRRNEPCAWLRLNEEPLVVRVSQREVEEYKGNDFLIGKVRLVD